MTIDYLYEKGRVIVDSTGCAKWTAARTRSGYGVINLSDAPTTYAHRLVYLMKTGERPEQVMHSCDTPMCVNIDHLSGGTNADNAADMSRKGRGRGVNSRPKRPTWDETWMNVAEVIAQRSRCIRRAAGCVIVTPSNRIVATGFNGPPAGYIKREAMCDEFCPRAKGTVKPADYDDCVASHAEMNAIMHSDRSARENGYAYVSTSPCYGCAKVLSNSGIRGIKTRVLPQDWYRDPKSVLEFVMQCGLEVVIM